MSIIIFGRAIQFLLSLVMIRVATTLLSPEDIGQVSLILSTISFFALFLVNPVGMFINRRLHAWQSSGMARLYLIRYVNYLLLVALIAALGLPMLYMSGIANFGITVGWLIFLVCGSLLFNTINQTAIPSLNLLGDSSRFILLSIATVAASLVCALLFVTVLKPQAEYWVFGLLLGQAILGFIGTRVLFKQLKKKEAAGVVVNIQKRHLHVLFRFAWPVAIAAALAWMQGQGYRFLMVGELGLAELGLFVAGYGISAGLLAGFESVLTTYYQPRLYRDANINDPTEQGYAWKRYASAVIPSLLLTVTLIIALAPEFTRIFLGENFQDAVDFVLWGALAEAARVLIGIYSLIAHVLMRTHWLIIPNLIGAFLAITLSALFIPKFGASGVGMGLLLSGFTVVILMHVFLASRVGGSVSKVSVLTALLFSGVLWGMILLLRYNLGVGSWGMLAGVVVPAGVVYFGFQYFLLRKKLI